jgi:hypothetical protein
MKCPACGGLNVRASRRTPRLGFINQIRGYDRYRCRDCRKAFWEKLPANPDERVRRKRQRGWAHFVQTQGRRRFLEITLFLTMLLIFAMMIRILINRDDSPRSQFRFPVPRPPAVALS